MKNSLLLLMLLLSLHTTAQSQEPPRPQNDPRKPCAALTFRTGSRQRMRVFIDRKLMNPRPDVFVKTVGIEPGYHFVTLEITSQGAVNRQSSRILLVDGQESVFEVARLGWRRFRIAQVGNYTLPPNEVCSGPPTAGAPSPAPSAPPSSDAQYPEEQEAVATPDENAATPPANDEAPLCTRLLTDSALTALREEIEQADSEERKLDIAVLTVRKAAVRATDVWDLMALFADEETRLSFAKFAYHYTCDPQHYRVVEQGFSSEATAEALKKYLEELPAAPE